MLRKLVLLLPLALAACFVTVELERQVRGGAAAAGDTERVSLDSAGNQANEDNERPAISADGRFVAFYSRSTNLVPSDTKNKADIFVHDRQTGTTERVSADSAGNQSDGDSNSGPAISADGRYVAFDSEGSNLVPADTNGIRDVFIHDRQAGVTERMSVDSAGNQSDALSSGAAISADGRYVAFGSNATNLVPADTNGAYDLFVHDRQTGTTERVSIDSAGGQANGTSRRVTLSADGGYVAFESDASNLVPNDSNGQTDVFVRHLGTGATERVSLDSAGNQADGDSYAPAISADGRYVGFESVTSNLVAMDTNGFGDVFVRDRLTGATRRISVDSAGNQGDDSSQAVDLNADGRFIAFDTYATNLVPGDTNGVEEVLVHDRQTGVTSRDSTDGAGNRANDISYDASVTADGRYVAFESHATNLVPGDTNGDEDVFVHDNGEPATPTLVQGNVDCRPPVEPLDALQLLLFIAHRPPSVGNNCPDIGTSIDAFGLTWGDINCDDEVNLLDVVALLRYVAEVPYTLPSQCPDVGQVLT